MADPSEYGANQQGHEDELELYITGGAEVRLLNSLPDYGDDQTAMLTHEVDGTGYESQTVAEADWSISTDAANRSSTLSNGVAVDFGETNSDWGTVVAVVIDPDDSSDRYILSDEPNNPALTGEDYSFDIGSITHRVGAEEP